MSTMAGPVGPLSCRTGRDRLETTYATPLKWIALLSSPIAEVGLLSAVYKTEGNGGTQLDLVFSLFLTQWGFHSSLFLHPLPLNRFRAWCYPTRVFTYHRSFNKPLFHSRCYENSNRKKSTHPAYRPSKPCPTIHGPFTY